MASTSALDTEIRGRIEAFLADISSLVRRSALEAVHEALGGDGTAAAPARRGPGRPRGSGKAGGGNGRKKTSRSGRGRRSSADLESMTAEVLSHVRAHPGQGAEQIGAALGLTSKELRLPMQKLAADRAVRTEGQRRGTKYFAGGRGAGPGGGRKAKRGSKSGRKGARKGSRKKAGARGSSQGAQAESIAASSR